MPGAGCPILNAHFAFRVGDHARQLATPPTGQRALQRALTPLTPLAPLTPLTPLFFAVNFPSPAHNLFVGRSAKSHFGSSLANDGADLAEQSSVESIICG